MIDSGNKIPLIYIFYPDEDIFTIRHFIKTLFEYQSPNDFKIMIKFYNDPDLKLSLQREMIVRQAVKCGKPFLLSMTFPI